MIRINEFTGSETGENGRWDAKRSWLPLSKKEVGKIRNIYPYLHLHPLPPSRPALRSDYGSTSCHFIPNHFCKWCKHFDSGCGIYIEQNAHRSIPPVGREKLTIILRSPTPELWNWTEYSWPPMSHVGRGVAIKEETRIFQKGDFNLKKKKIALQTISLLWGVTNGCWRGGDLAWFKTSPNLTPPLRSEPRHTWMQNVVPSSELHRPWCLRKHSPPAAGTPCSRTMPPLRSRDRNNPFLEGENTEHLKFEFKQNYQIILPIFLTNIGFRPSCVFDKASVHLIGEQNFFWKKTLFEKEKNSIVNIGEPC